MKPTANRFSMIITLCFTLSASIQAQAGPADAATPIPPQTTQATSLERGGDAHVLAVGAGVVGGAILYNLVTCGMAVSAVVGGLVGDYLYRKYAASPQTLTASAHQSP